jgi:4-hydroxy-4-methyl-2-oxoglutarate aldolase
MSDTLSQRLGRCYSSAVHDVLRAMGHERCVLPPAIRALAPGMRLAGPVWTVSGHIDRTKTSHDTLLAWTALLSKAPAGTVVICQPHTHEIALMGELSAAALKLKGVRGYLVDGGTRDVDMIVELGFPVFCSFATPADIGGRWIPDSFGAPVTIGAVTIASGDYVLADADGAVVIPQAIAEAAVTRTEEVAQTENAVRSAILGGMDPQAAYLKYGKF